MLRRKPTRSWKNRFNELDAIERKSKNESNNKKVEDDTKTKDRVAQRIGFTKKWSLFSVYCIILLRGGAETSVKNTMLRIQKKIRAYY